MERLVLPCLRRPCPDLAQDRRGLLFHGLPQARDAGAEPMTGAELRALHLAAGLTQIDLARLAGVGRHAVQYWEGKAAFGPRGWALERIAEVIGPLPVPDYAACDARARGWRVSHLAALDAWSEARLADELARLAEGTAQWKARRRVACGAKTRKGLPCRNRSEPGKRRCKFHGGKSTGPRTAEGRARFAEAQRRRLGAVA